MDVTEMNGSKWVGINKDDYCYNTNILVRFKNIFVINDMNNFNIYISANNSYKLWINGVYVCSGPCKSDKWRQFFDKVNISNFIKCGTNVIAVEVLYYKPSLYRDGDKMGPINTVTNTLGPMLALKCECEDENGNTIEVVSTGNSNWKYAINDKVKWHMPEQKYGFIPLGAFQSFYGENDDFNWKTSKEYNSSSKDVINRYDTDGSSWGEFSPLPLLKRPIPLMQEKENYFLKEMKIISNDYKVFSFGEDDKCSLSKNSNYVVELDAGELVTGYFVLHTLGGKDCKIKVIYAESYSGNVIKQYRQKGIRDDNTNYKIHGVYDEFFPSNGENIFETHNYRTFRFVKIEVETKSSDVVLYKPHYVETGYPLEIKASFKTNCNWTDYLWNTSLRTLKRCMHDTYIDCPYYERLQYAMDTRLEILFTYMVSGDTRLAKKAIEDFYFSFTPYGLLQSRAPSDESNIIPAFSLYWIFMLHDYYWQTGDSAFLKKYRPAIDSILEWFETKKGKYGLTQNYYYWEFIDWVEEWQDDIGQLSGIPKACEAGPSTTSNLLYALALQYAAEIMEITGRESCGIEYKKRADEILKSIEQYCWNEDAYLYGEGPNIEEYTQHAQVLSVLTHLCSGEKARRILENSIKNIRVYKCTFSFSFYLFRALEESNIYCLTEGLWNKWKEAEKLNLTTFPEDLTRQRSDCHGWSALPLYEFTRNMLGVKPLKPGWKEVEIRPQCDYIDEIEGVVPVPSGEIKVNLKKEANYYKMIGSVPIGIPFNIVLPDGRIYKFDNGGNFDIKA